MGQVLQFRLPALEPDDMLPEIDLATAVEVALRDLADIAPFVTVASARAQLSACREVLEAGLRTAFEPA